MQTLKHPAMPSATFHHHNFIYLLKNCSSHAQPAGLTCIEFHNCLSFPQLGCSPRGSATGPAAVSAGNISCGFVDARLIAGFNADLETPCHAQCNISQSQHFVFSKKRFIMSATSWTDMH